VGRKDLAMMGGTSERGNVKRESKRTKKKSGAGAKAKSGGEKSRLGATDIKKKTSPSLIDGTENKRKRSCQKGRRGNL